ncbi:hypothetical protein GCM10023116_41970 [Kistimonas scapharcae]|uniref:histidine kinase n=1 Tax=Kistimonas scapharcae TaxID=1036133 RepID=A0ABP8V6M7_9GAMM
MKISNYNQIIAVSTLVIGVCIFGFIWTKYQKVEQVSRFRYESGMSLKTFQHFSTMFQVWLTTQDLFFSGKQSYLARGINEQSKSLVNTLQSLELKNERDQLLLRDIESKLKKNDGVIASLMTVSTVSHDTWLHAINTSDDITSSIIVSIEQLAERLDQKKYQLDTEFADAVRQLKVWGVVLIVIYLLMIMLGTRWISKNIVKPLENIRAIATQQLISHEDVEFVQRDGPLEVKELARSIQNLTQHIKVEMHKAEEQRNNADEANNRLTMIMDSVPNAIVLVDQAGVIKDINMATEKLFSDTDEHILNARLSDYLPAFAREDGQFDRSCVVGSVQEGMLAPHIKHPYVEYSGCLISIFGESHYLITISDINERKHNQKALMQLNQQLIQAEKMASVGQLAAGMAHEINNPIGYIQSNIEMLGEYFVTVNECMALMLRGESEKAAKYYQDHDLEFIFSDIEVILHACQDGTVRVTRIIKGLGNYTHLGNEKMEPVNINALITQSLGLVENELKYKVEIDVFLEAPLVIMGFPQKLLQVLVNLLVNASHAIDGSGKVWVKTQRVDSEANIIIQDNGHGISADNMEKLFDPFFTTKPVGKGMGLGLHIVRSIMEEHNGYVTVTSTVGEGAEFILHLPLILEESQS